MKTLPRYAPLITILALLVLVAIGGSALANNRSTPNVESEPATITHTPISTTSVEEQPNTAPAETPPTTQEVHETPVQTPVSPPVQVPQPPQVPLNYQYYDDDDYDGWDDDLDDFDDD